MTVILFESSGIGRKSRRRRSRRRCHECRQVFKPGQQAVLMFDDQWRAVYFCQVCYRWVFGSPASSACEGQ